jgi:ankyrin repeat protein
VQVTNQKGETPLHWAVNWNREYAARRLMECGADANAADKLGRSALSLSASSPSMRRILEEGTLTATLCFPSRCAHA